MAKVNVPRTISKVIFLLIPIILLVLFFTKVVGTSYTPTGSMEPTIMSGDRVIYNRVAYKTRDISKGDIVIAKKNNVTLLKRVIGTEDDVITVKEGKLYVNDKEVLAAIGPDKTFTVPKGKVFLIGDNWENSNDSLKWDDPYVSENDILGRVYLSFGTNGGFHIALQ